MADEQSINIFEMQNQSQNVEWNLLDKLSCQRHPSEKILFLCMSESCPMDKLLCMECIDSSRKDHQHHLVSLGRFHTFLTTYSKQIQASNKKTQQRIATLRRQVNQHIDQLQRLTLQEIDIFGSQGSESHNTEQEKEQKLRQIVSRKIWSKLQINGNNQNVDEEIQAQITQYWEVTENVFHELLYSVSDLYSHHLHQVKINQNKIAFFGSEPNSSQEVETVKQTDSSGRTKSNTMKRYSYDERLEVIEEVRVYESQMSTAMSKRLVAKRRKIAMSTVTRWLRWWKTASNRHKYKQEKKAKQ